jgi:hypothetical protein
MTRIEATMQRRFHSAGGRAFWREKTENKACEPTDHQLSLSHSGILRTEHRFPIADTFPAICSYWALAFLSLGGSTSAFGSGAAVVDASWR